jgi:hypothetical protein
MSLRTYEDICENYNRILDHELCMSNRWHESSIKEYGSKVMLRENIDSVTGMEQLNKDRVLISPWFLYNP